ncbi:Ig-like domain-containing protein [Vulgatibacter incomptus]|uniref:Ig-like domain-containing protein n=1 Tax=Vulgatibacter incomptus TaxID=1391653 RepID=UPI001470603C|nr:Ig-like domain-containing protein [Vulgatibacter incomptus]
MKVTPATSRLHVGSTIRFTAVGFSTAGDPIPRRPVVWSSHSTAIAIVDEQGTVRGVAPGVSRISATVDGIQGAAMVTVLPTLDVRVEIDGPRTIELVVGQSIQLTARAVYEEGRVLPDATIEWESDLPEAVQVNGNGRIVAMAVGSATVRAVFGEASASVSVRVLPPGFESIRISGAPESLAIGDQVQLQATVKDVQGRTIPDADISWTVTPAERASISNEGVLIGRRSGIVQVRASVGAVNGTVDVAVFGMGVSIAIEPESPIELDLGESIQLLAAVLDENGDEVPGRSFVWESNSKATAEVNADGFVRALGGGKATIIVLSEDRSLRSSVEIRVRVPKFVELSVGNSIACGVASDGRAFCWGSVPGRQGPMAIPMASLPGYSVSGLSVSAIDTVGFMGTICGMSSGSPFCLGGNQYGQAGNGTTTEVREPYRFELELVSFAVGPRHSCGLHVDGRAFCWGENWSGQLGVSGGPEGFPPYSVLDPVEVSGGIRFSQIHASDELGSSVGISVASCGVSISGVGYCWGTGALGNGSTEYSVVPVEVAGGLQFRKIEIAPGEEHPRFPANSLLGHACGLTVDGKVYCWGRNLQGQLGSGSFEQSPVPVPIADDDSFLDVKVSSLESSRVASSCGLRADGVVLCWGDNRYSQLGFPGCTASSNDPECVEYHPTPTPVQTDERFVQIGMGGAYSCGLTAEGVAFCWGALAGGGESWQVPTPILGHERWLER